MDVWLIHKDCLSGAELQGPAFIDEVACQNYCKTHDRDFVDYIPVKKEAEEISKDRVIVDLRVFPLDRTKGEISGINHTGEIKEIKKPEVQIMKKQIVFYDSEFTGLRQDTDLISICFIGRNKDGKKIFYAEFNDYDESKLDDWLKENIIANLLFNDKETFYQNRKNKVIFMKDNTSKIKEELIKYFALFDEVEIWSDCLSYDWVLFNNIFGTAFDIPKNIYYIPFDLCTLMKVKNIDPDINREEFVGADKDSMTKHNCFYDTVVIEKCYKKLMGV